MAITHESLLEQISNQIERLSNIDPQFSQEIDAHNQEAMEETEEELWES